MITAAAFMMACAAYGQGQFLFNTRDTGANNVLTFVDASGAKIAGANYFVDVLAGADANSLVDVSANGDNRLVINRLQAGNPSGLTSPFSAIYTLPGKAGGSSVTVGYRAYQGTDYASATVKSGLIVVPGTVQLTEPPTPPNEVAVGTSSVTLVRKKGAKALKKKR